MVLNRPSLAEQPHISVAKIPLQITCGRPTKAEIKAAINKQKSGKAICPHNISLEALKVDSSLSTDMLNSFFGRIWEEEKTPTEWAEGHIVKLPKKSYLRKCTTGSPYFLFPARFSTESFSTLYRNTWTRDFRTNKQESGKIAHAKIT